MEWKSKNYSRKTRLLINILINKKAPMWSLFYYNKKELLRALSPNKIIKQNYSGSTTLSIA